LNEVLALPVHERAGLVELILDSRGEAPDKERLETWAAETEPRLMQLIVGNLKQKQEKKYLRALDEGKSELHKRQAKYERRKAAKKLKVA